MTRLDELILKGVENLSLEEKQEFAQLLLAVPVANMPERDPVGFRIT